MGELENKEQRLGERLSAVPSLIVAYSGGVDSAYLAYAAHRALGERMLAVTALSRQLLGARPARGGVHRRTLQLPS